MIPIVGLSGKSGSGKTTVLALLIGELKRRGLRVGAIKHTRHPATLDQPGKDTAVLYEAGAAAVALTGAGQVGMYMRVTEPWSPAAVAMLFPEVDLILVEGCHEADIPRLWVLRRGVAEELPAAKGIVGYVTDLPLQTELPTFGFDEIGRIADLMEDYVRRLGPRREVKLFVNERPVRIKPFIKDFFLNTISAMVASLRDTGAARRILILLEKPGGESGPENGDD